MINIPEKTKSILPKDGYHKNFRIHFPNNDHEDIYNSNIEDDSVSFTESVNSSETFKLNICETPEISFDLRNVTDLKTGMIIECYHLIENKNPEVLAEFSGETFKNEYTEGHQHFVIYDSLDEFSNCYMRISTSDDNVSLNNIYYQAFIPVPGNPPFEIGGKLYLWDKRIENSYDFYIPIESFKNVNGPLVISLDSEETTYLTVSIIEGISILDDVRMDYIQIPYGKFVISELTRDSSNKNKISVRASNSIMDNLNNENYDDKALTKTKKSFTYKYDPVRRALAASGVANADFYEYTPIGNGISLGGEPVKVSEIYSTSTSANLKVKRKKKSSKLTSTKLKIKFWFDGKNDISFISTYRYGLCSEDKLLTVKKIVDVPTSTIVQEEYDKFIEKFESDLKKKEVTINKALKRYFKNEIFPMLFTCYFSSIKNFKSGSTYNRYGTPHQFGTPYYTKFSTDTTEKFDYILAVPQQFRVTVSFTSNIETWGNKKEFTLIYDLDGALKNTKLNRAALTYEITNEEIFDQFSFSETTTDCEDGSYFMLFNEVKSRDIFEALSEFKGRYFRVSRQGKIELVDLLKNLGLTPSDSLYPSNELYPMSSSYDRIIPADEYMKCYYVDEEELPFGAIWASYTNTSDTESYITVYAEGIDEDTDRSTYRTYYMDNNLFISRKQWTATSLKKYLKPIVNLLSSIHYTKGELELMGRPDIQAGDTITLQDEDGIHCFIVSNRSIKGIQHLVDSMQSI